MEINEFETWYKKIHKSKDEEKYLESVWELMETPYTEYHYSLILRENTNEYFKDTLWSRFGEHEDAEILLFNKLENNEDKQFIGEIIFNLGKIVDLKNSKQKDKLYGIIKNYVKSTDDKIRENAIIVLGWLGSIKDLEFLSELLLNDKNNKCRAWSASALMQIKFRRKNNTFVEKSLPYLYKAIKQEEDYLVISSIIETVREFTKKKFDIKQKDIDILDKDKLKMAKEKIEKYFKKLYKE